MSCSIELAAVDDPCKSWYTLRRTATDTFMTASESSEIKTRSSGILQFELTVLLVVLLRDEIDGILNVLISDIMLIQGVLQEIERIRAQCMAVFTEDLRFRV